MSRSVDRSARLLRRLALATALLAAGLFWRDGASWRAYGRRAAGELARALEREGQQGEALSEARRAREAAEEELEHQRHASFRSSLAAAVEALAGLRVRTAARELDAVPEEHIGWEWGHLRARVDLTTLPVFEAPADIARLAPSADGERLALATFEGELFSLTTRDWEATRIEVEGEPPEWSALAVRGEEVLAIAVGDASLPATCLSLAPLEDAELCGLEGGLVCLRDAQGPRVLDEHGDDVGAVAVAPGERWLASASDDGVVRVHGGEAFSETRELGRHDEWVRALAFDASGTRLASGDDAGLIRVWDPASGALLSELDLGLGAVRALAFLGEGLSCATDLGRGRLTQGYELRTYEVEDLGWAESVACLFERGGRSFLAYANGASLEVLGYEVPRAAARWSVATGEVSAVAAGPKAERVVAGTLGGAVLGLDASSGELVWEHALEGAVLSLAFDGGGAKVAAGTRGGEVVAWRAEDGVEVARWSAGEAVAGLALSEGGERATWCGWAGASGRVELSSGEELARRAAPPLLVLAAAVLDGRCAWAGDGGTLRLWDVESGGRLAALRERGLGRVESLALSRDGGRLVCVAGATRLTVVDLVEGLTLAQADEPGRAIRALAFDPEGERFVAGGHAGRVSVHEAASAEALIQLEGPRASVGCVAFSPDGERVLAGTTAGEVWVWAASADDPALEGER